MLPNEHGRQGFAILECDAFRIHTFEIVHPLLLLLLTLCHVLTQARYLGVVIILEVHVGDL